MTWYRVLGVEPSIPQADLKKVYRQLAKSTHPDRNPQDPAAHERFKQVSQAWAVLGDPDKRALYDLDLAQARAREVPREPPRPPPRSRWTAPPPVDPLAETERRAREQTRGWSEQARRREQQARQDEVERAIRTANLMREQARVREMEAREREARELEEKLRRLREA